MALILSHETKCSKKRSVKYLIHISMIRSHDEHYKYYDKSSRPPDQSTWKLNYVITGLGLSPGRRLQSGPLSSSQQRVSALAGLLFAISSDTCTSSHTTQLSGQRYRRVCSGRVDFEKRPPSSIFTTWRQRAITTTTTTTSAQRRQQQNRSNNSNIWTFIDSRHTLLSWISLDLGGRGFEEQG